MRAAFLATPRSGTQWTCRVMRALGWHFGHECMGNQGLSCGFWTWRFDVEWMPSTHRSPPDTPLDHVFHLVRHPLSTLRTMHVVMAQGKLRRWMQQVTGVREDIREECLIYWTMTRGRLLAEGHQVVHLEWIEDDWRHHVAPAIGVPAELPEVPIPNKKTTEEAPRIGWEDLERLNLHHARVAQGFARELGYNY